MLDENMLQYVTLIALFAGGMACAAAVYFAWRYARLLDARTEARSLIEEARRNAKELDEQTKEQLAALQTQMRHRSEKDLKRISQNTEKLKKQIADEEAELQDRLAEKETLFSEQQSVVDKYENQVNEIERRVNQLAKQKADLKESLVQQLLSRAAIEKSAIVSELTEKVLQDYKTEITKSLQVEEEEKAASAEKDAKKLLALALNRFIRPYCPERGIGYLNFTSDPGKLAEQRERVLGPEQCRLRWVEKHCGVDLVFDEANNSINVYGFDPVRRELGRATVERMLSDKNPWDENRVEEMVERIKKELFRRIMQDGQQIAKELGAPDLHAEIKNMMGALRYRYSFTQNQYFHCAEVGLVCGLLAAELGVPVPDARRAGLLHDLGKAMDHTTEGGHAVLGADFIKQHGEKDHIVHAVRAHHFDEQPSTDLAYLVIAADAISGARPGARRSTAQSYTQKIQDLQMIAQNFPGVTDTHVVNAGREVRVYVDSRQVDDSKALGLSRDIAKKIEAEMAYPGQIKITVVRSTQAVEYAR